MVPPFIYRIVGISLMIVGIADRFLSRGDWQFHAFYTGLALLMAGQALGYLARIWSLNNTILEDLRKSTSHDDIGAIRWLLDQLHDLARKDGPPPHSN